MNLSNNDGICHDSREFLSSAELTIVLQLRCGSGVGSGFWVLGSLAGRVHSGSVAGLRRPEDFDVWQLAWELKQRVYAFTATLPASRDFRFCEDIRRAARSGPDNVAEGFSGQSEEFHVPPRQASLGESEPALPQVSGMVAEVREMSSRRSASAPRSCRRSATAEVELRSRPRQREDPEPCRTQNQHEPRTQHLNRWSLHRREISLARAQLQAFGGGSLELDLHLAPLSVAHRVGRTYPSMYCA